MLGPEWINKLPAGLRMRRLASTVWSEITFPQASEPGHFYSPLPNRSEVVEDSERIFDRSCGTVPEISLREHAQLGLLQQLQCHASQLKPDATWRFSIPNVYLPAADAVVLLSLLLEHRPARYVEIGSGYSSALVLDTRERFLRGQLDCTFIEPDATRLRSLLRPGEVHLSTIIETRVQDVETHVFSSLGPGDMLFIDGSHVSKVGSDLNDVLFRILPALPTGVLIHFHDILWPFEYSREEVLRGRSWNEAYLLRAFLANNHAYTIHLFGSWLEQCQSSAWKSAFPIAQGSVASSLWLVKQADQVS